MKLALVLMLALTPMVSSRRIQEKAVKVDNQNKASLDSSIGEAEYATESQTEAQHTESFETSFDEIEDATDSGSLKLDWEDCGDASTHTKITDFTPSTLSLGTKTTMAGTGDIDQDVTDGATFDLEMTGIIGKLLSCKGDASVTKTCNLPLNVGSLTYVAIPFPIKKGDTTVKVDIQLSSNLPSYLASTTTIAKATSNSGDKLFCMKIKSSQGSQSSFVEAEVATESEGLESSSVETEDATEFETEAEDTEGLESSFVETEDATVSETEAYDTASLDSSVGEEDAEMESQESAGSFKKLIPGSIVAFKGGRQGKYCSDEGNRIICNRGGIGPWEKFKVVNAGSGRIALKGGRNGFRKFCADEGNTIKCNRGGIGPWEKFVVVKAGSGKIALRGGKFNKHCADEGSTVKCNRGGVGPWEKFTVKCLAGSCKTKKPKNFVVFEGQGHCRSGQIYASRAWELAPASNGRKGFNTPEYKTWVQEAWRRCLKKNSGVKFVSAWIDAGYRCYIGNNCSPNNAGNTKSWKWNN